MTFTECYKKHSIMYTALIVLFVTAAVVVPTTVLLVRDRDTKNVIKMEYNPIVIPENTTASMLSITNDLSNLSSWNVVKYVYGKENWNIVDNETVQVVYQQNSVNPSSNKPGGFVFYVSPKDKFPTEEVYLSYKVMFPNSQPNSRKLLDTSSFDWVKGGMLPGLWIGKMGAQDTNHMDDGASCRIMWRANGIAEAYLYVTEQLPEFYQQLGYFDNEPYGESLYRGFNRFVANEWNDVVMRIKLNTVGQSNGILQVSVNNKTMTYDKMVWRKNETMLINGITMHSFFGGSDDSWATPKEQNIYFSKFTLYS